MRNTLPIAKRVAAIVGGDSQGRGIPGPDPIWQTSEGPAKERDVVSAVEELLDEGFGPTNLVVLCGSAGMPPTPVAAVKLPEPSRPIEIVAVPTPLPLPGQLKSIESRPASTEEPVDPMTRVALANAAARIQPGRAGFINAIQEYPYTDGALYQVYASPGQVTDIALQEGDPTAPARRPLDHP